MHCPTLAHAESRPEARLRIHSGGSTHTNGWSFDALLQRVRAHWLDGPRGRHDPFGLEIHDLQGHRLLAVDDAGPLVDVALPPGTYQVSTRIGRERRGYTIALEPGGAVDLVLRPPLA